MKNIISNIQAIGIKKLKLAFWSYNIHYGILNETNLHLKQYKPSRFLDGMIAWMKEKGTKIRHSRHSNHKKMLPDKYR